MNQQVKIGDIIDVTITGVQHYGAFALLPDRTNGLIHISEIDTKRIEKPEDVLSVGQEVEAKIINIDWEEKKISLSMKALIAPEEPEVVEEAVEEVVEDGEALVYSTDETVEVEEPIEVEEAAEEATEE